MIKNCIFKDERPLSPLTCNFTSKLFMLQQKPDIRSGFVFCMGEFHDVVFSSLKVIRKLIDGDGWDQAFDKVGKGILSEKQDTRLTMFVSWFTYACLNPCLNYGISNSCAFVLNHCVLRAVTIRVVLLYEVDYTK